MSNSENTEITEISNGITKIFSLQGNTSIIDSRNHRTLEEFKKYLTEKISYLMENDFERLINILYRIDIDEEKLQQIFADKNNTPGELCDLIIKRQLQKIQFRKQFKKGEF
jgi:hypothetical protein